MATTRVILYARLSVTRDESVSIQGQFEAGRAYCAARGWEVVAEHKDDGVSASASAPEDRVGWQAVLAHPRGSYDLVVVRKVDRLARRVIDFLNADKALQARGAAVVSVEDSIDMSTAAGRAMATMLAVFAEMEAEAIKARVNAARKVIIRDGRVAGGKAPFGYWNTPAPDGKGKVLTKKAEEISIVLEAAQRILNGDSIGSVATYLDEVAPPKGRKNDASHWTTTTTKRLLSNPILVGHMVYNPGNKSKSRGTDVLRDETGMPVVREDLAVLSLEDFRRLQVSLTKNEARRAPTESFLSGIVWCGECDRKMYRNAKNVRGVRVKVFQCQGKEGCGQQVSHLEEHVTKRFLETYGDRAIMLWSYVPTDYDHTEIDNQMMETRLAMAQDDADIMSLAERLVALTELRKNQPEVRYVEDAVTTTGAQDWGEDPRSAILRRFSGVEIRKGKVGRVFDEKRLSFREIRREPFTYVPPVPEPFDEERTARLREELRQAFSAETGRPIN